MNKDLNPHKVPTYIKYRKENKKAKLRKRVLVDFSVNFLIALLSGLKVTRKAVG